jgi:hypothetical protein
MAAPDTLARIEDEALADLEFRGIAVSRHEPRIIRVDRTAIVFRNAYGRVMTAWKWVVEGRLTITLEPGMPIEPHPALIPPDAQPDSTTD